MAASLLIQTATHKAEDGVEGRYALLNRGAPNTVLFCPGAAGNCYMLSWFQGFANEHPDTAFLTIDRWPRADPSTRDSSILDSLSSFTVDLLDSLGINQFSIASHSAGVYQQLHLAQTIPSRVKALHLIAVHIPAEYLQSRAANLLLRVPDSVFSVVKTIDRKGVTWMNRLGLRESIRNPTQYYKAHLGNAAIDKEMDKLTIDSANVSDAGDIDYALAWQRSKGADGKFLSSLYINCTHPITWYTSNDDVLFGPEAVNRIQAQMINSTHIDIEVVENTNHANIFRRKDVWLSVISA